MPQNPNNKITDFLFIPLIILLILGISLFNFIVDPYYIFRDSTIKGFNDVKTHKYSNKRTILYSDVKINHKGKDTAFTGNCLLSHYDKGLDNVAFFTITVVEVEEIVNIIKNIHKIAPNIKTIYWGLFLDDLCYKGKKVDKLSEEVTRHLKTEDFINLFFSWNTTKYSIQTVMDSIKNKDKKDIFIYPFREIANAKYDQNISFDFLKEIQDIYNYSKENDIELIIYYSALNISKKIHMMEKGIWEKNLEFKKRLTEITPFYDYSFSNIYNIHPLDENSIYYIDNVHPTKYYNDLLVNDLLSDNKKIGILVTKDNVDRLNEEDTNYLKEYMNSNKKLTEEIKNVKPEDTNKKIKQSEQKIKGI